jgi:serine/threonine protein phosphatase PrpC
MATSYQYARAFASRQGEPQDLSAIFERGDSLVVVVADGGGGIRGGGAASRGLVGVVGSAVKNPAFPLERIEAWMELFKTADAGLAANRTGETTGVVLVLGPRRLIGISTGNSEAWVVTPEGIDNLTVSQRTRDRLGSSTAFSTTFDRPAPADPLLIASDGLFKFAAMDVIARRVRGDAADSIDVAAERLVELVRFKPGKVAEDIAVVLIRPGPPPGGPSA